MKEIYFYLFLFLFLNVNLKEETFTIENGFDSESDSDSESQIEINYIKIKEYNNNKEMKFLLNPRSNKVVIFTHSQPKRNLKSNVENDYLDHLKIEIQDNSKNIELNISGKKYEFKTYDCIYDSNYFSYYYSKIDGYIGTKDKTEFSKKVDLSDNKYGYKTFFNNKDKNKFIMGTDVDIDDYKNDDLVSIEPSLKKNNELSLSLSHFTFKSISKRKDKYQYKIEDDGDNYFDSKKKVFISLILKNYHIAPFKWIIEVFNKSKIIVTDNNMTNITYFNKNLTKFNINYSEIKQKDINLIFDLSTAINMKLFNNEKQFSFLGYNESNDIFLSNYLLNYSINYNYDDETVTIIGDDDDITDIESFVPVVLFIISCVIVIIIIIGVVFIIRKNKNNNTNIDNQDSNNAGLVPN